MAQPIFLHNTASRSVERLQTIEPDRVRLYTCGPTVYGHAHIGNYRTYIFEDVLVKTLRHFGYAVDWVMNVTDVGHLTSDEDEGEDKLEVGARREGTTAWDVAKKYEADFFMNLSALNIDRPGRVVRATDTIAEQIELIKRLEAGGHTYRLADGIYFDSSTFPDYGKMAHLNLAGQRAGARVAVQEGKRHLSDFALWKFSPADRKRDMEWESPWGIGFPGWHIECSAIAMRELGEQLDIHTGGADHIPVHHPNEIAQSESATGKQFARIWMHGEFLLIDGGKMSKSLGNVYLLSDLAERGFDPLDFRFFTYSATYRSKLNFTWDTLKAAQVGLERLRAAARTIRDEAAGEVSPAVFTAIKSGDAALADDLNIPQLVATLWEVVRSDLAAADKLAFIERFEPILSLDLFRAEADAVVPEAVASLLAERQKARENRDWAAADVLRDQIEQAGFQVKDTPEGQKLEKIR